MYKMLVRVCQGGHEMVRWWWSDCDLQSGVVQGGVFFVY